MSAVTAKTRYQNLNPMRDTIEHNDNMPSMIVKHQLKFTYKDKVVASVGILKAGSQLLTKT